MVQVPAFQLPEVLVVALVARVTEDDAVAAEQAGGGEAGGAVQRGAVGVGHVHVLGGDGQTGGGDVGGGGGGLARGCNCRHRRR